MNHFLRRFLWCLVVVGSLVPVRTPAAIADTQLFAQAGWVIDGAEDSGSTPTLIAVTVNGAPVGSYSELKVYHDFGASRPQVYSVKGTAGALRSVLPGGAFGGTFYATGYWDCQVGLMQNMSILSLDIALQPANPGSIKLQGRASNSSIEARDFTLTIAPPTATRVQADLTYTLTAARNLCVDQGRQANHEGFRAARVASNYLSTPVHDSDRAGYNAVPASTVCADLRNQSGFVFANPVPMSGSGLTVAHSTTMPRNTPTLIISPLQPGPIEMTPQGWVTGSTDPNADNVDVWINWNAAMPTYSAGERIAVFAFRLVAIQPGGPCVETETPPNAFTPLTPARILDTRNGTGGIPGPLGPGATVGVSVTGVGGVPASGVGAVVVNVTATGGTVPSFLTVFPAGQARPLASSLNFVANQDVANLVIAKVGADGKVAAYNNVGTVHVVFDVWSGGSRRRAGTRGRTESRTRRQARRRGSR